MTRTFVRQDTQVRKSELYDDSVAPTEAAFETNPVYLQDDLTNVRSMLHELRDVRTSNWWAALIAPTTFPGEGAAARGVQDVNEDLYDIERKRILRRRAVVGANVLVPTSASATSNLLLNSIPLNTETVTIDVKTYTFVTALTPTEGEVLIGASASDCADNLIAAINHGPGNGTLYSCAVAHPSVSALAGAGDSLDVTALVAGTGGNTIATTETLSDGASVWTGSTLSGGAGDVVILDASGELPGNTTAAVGVVTTRGTVVAQATTFGVAGLAEVAGATNISPKNLCIVVDTATGDPVLDGSGREIYALLQTESATDGHTIGLSTPNRAQLSFVVRNATYDDLVLAAAGYIGGKTVDYSPVERYAFEDMPEIAWLGDDFVDVGAGSGSVTRQVAYDNQGTTPVDLTTNATLDLEGAGLVWAIRDDLEADLFTITEGSAGGTSTIGFGAAVDVFDNNAVSNLFAGPLTVDDDGTDIQIGVTAGQINTTGADDFELQAGGELYFDDGNRSGSTWATDGIKLSESSTEWDDFETAFGEVSLFSAILKAYNTQKRAKKDASVTADINANVLITGAGGGANLTQQMPSYKGLTFVDDVEIYINGLLQRNGANAAANNDVYPSAVATEQATGDFYCEYALKYRGGLEPDVIQMIVWGNPTP